MATIKFIVQGKSDNASISLRLSIDKTKSFKRTTGYSINPKDWSTTTNYPKLNNPDNKNLKTYLSELKLHVERALNKSTSSKTSITSEWLKNQIDTFHGKDKHSELNYLIPFTEFYIEELKTQKKVSDSTLKKRITIKNKLIAFEKATKRKYLIKDVHLILKSSLIDFFRKNEKLSESTIGKYLKEIKTVCLRAKTQGIEVSYQLDSFKGFNTIGYKITLSHTELERIAKLNYKEPILENIKDWLIIGSYTGQRGSDFLRMEKSMIEEIESYKFIVLTQQKTKKQVQIPIHPIVKNILDKRGGEFPKKLSNNIESAKTIFNMKIKEICKDAKIIEITEGNLKDPKTNRIKKGNYPKYKLIASHVCRRSFATNFYALKQYPTPILMNITAHSTEKMFLEYIGKKPIDYSLQLAKIWNPTD